MKIGIVSLGLIAKAYKRLEDMKILGFDHLKTMLALIGFADISFTTESGLNVIIAFTSQLPSIISNGFIKSETAKRYKGYSAGSYRDLTRVAWLNPTMCSELFLENKRHLLQELDTFIRAIELLEVGRQRKREVDGP